MKPCDSFGCGFAPRFLNVSGKVITWLTRYRDQPLREDGSECRCFLFLNACVLPIPLMVKILHHLRWMVPYKSREKVHTCCQLVHDFFHQQLPLLQPPRVLDHCPCYVQDLWWSSLDIPPFMLSLFEAWLDRSPSRMFLFVVQIF